jgi:fructokinase
MGDNGAGVRFSVSGSLLMQNPAVLCLGEVLFDRIAHEVGLSPDLISTWTSYPGGAPANVACGLVKLATPAAFVGAVGQDLPGLELLQLFDRLGVNSQGIQQHPTAPTRIVDVLRDEAGDRSFGGFGGQETTVFADTFLKSEQLPLALFKTAQFLVTGTLGLAYPETGAAIQQALELAQSYNLKVVLDINWRPMFWPDLDRAVPQIQALLPQADILKLTLEEAAWLFGTVQPEAIASQLPQLLGVLVTAGAEGCSYWFGKHGGFLPAYKVAVVDTTGAGDAFLAGFLAQLWRKGLPALADPAQTKAMVQYASAVGAITTLKPGAIASQPTLEAVDAFLEMQG